MVCMLSQVAAQFRLKLIIKICSTEMNTGIRFVKCMFYFFFILLFVVVIINVKKAPRRIMFVYRLNAFVFIV